MSNLKCHFDSDGWLRGPISITHLFTPNHGSGFGTGRGVVMHTEDGYEAGTVDTFMNPANQVSAFFSIARDGSCHQYLPVGRGLSAWSQAGGNDSFRGIEDEDQTHPSIPLTAAQLTTFAQIFEACSAFDGFPLQITDSPSGQGLILHSDGGNAWGGHFSCPGTVRAAQRNEIIRRAKAIRAGNTPPAARTWKAEGQDTLAALCSQHLHEPVSAVLTKTAQDSGHIFAANLAGHLRTVFAADTTRCPAGSTWYHPVGNGTGPWTSAGMLSLAALAAELETDVSTMIALTIQHDQQLQPINSGYVNAVAAATQVKLPAGVVVCY